nr:hypothetical protein [Tanacetum cinerariifolium]
DDADDEEEEESSESEEEEDEHLAPTVPTPALQIRPALTIADRRRADDRLIGRLGRERRYFRNLSTTYAQEVAHSRDYCTQIMDYCQSQEVHTSTLVTQIEALQRDVSTLQRQHIDDEDRLTRHIQHEHAQRDDTPEDGDSLSQVEVILVEFKTQENKFCEKIRGLEIDVEFKNNKIEYLMNELEQVKKEKEGLDNKPTGFESASKDLDTLLGSQRSDKNKEGLGYNAVPPSYISLLTS